MARAFIFPGQGSQFIGMGKELYQAFAEAKEVFLEVDEALKQNLSKLMFDGDLEELTQTYNTQPALMAVSLAVIKVLEKQGGIYVKQACRFVAGHSLGEYSALCSSDSISLADCALLLRARGNTMHAAAKNGDGAMLALLGATVESAQSLADQARTKGICQIANDNGAGQFVLSGESEAVAYAAEIASNHGIKRAIKLNVSGAFHSDLMKQAEVELMKALDAFQIASPSVPLIANITSGEVSDPKEIRELLVRQVSGRVRWRESIDYMVAKGITSFVEIGAGKVLSTLVKRSYDQVESIGLQTPEEIEKFLG